MNLPGDTAAKDPFPGLDDRAWLKCDDVVALFENGWRNGQRPNIDDYLPADEALRQAILVELIHTELEYRLQAGEAARVEEYLQRYPMLGHDQSVLFDLIRAELDLRSGEPGFAPDEYLKRFPRHKDGLAAQGLHLPAPFAFPSAPSRFPPIVGCGNGEESDASRRVSLTVTGGPHQGRVFTFAGHDSFMVGRSAQAHFRLQDKDKRISRVHFIVEMNPPDCQLMDMGSRNGTYVNDRRIEATTPLKEGDRIKVGHTSMRVSVQPSRTELPSTSASNVTVAYFGSSISRAAAVSHPVLPRRPAEACVRPRTVSGPKVEKCVVCARPRSAEDRRPAFDRPRAKMPMVCPVCWENACKQPQPVPGHQLMSELGRGGMGVVYLALRSADATPVALKTIIPAVVGSRHAIQKFIRESSILCNLSHPNIVAYRDVGEANGLLYFVMCIASITSPQ